jgi:uncharacterized protein
MLHSYSFSNFRGFRDTVEVSFRLTPAAPAYGWTKESPSGQRLTTAMAVIGPNAAGKTTLLQPLGFLAWFIPHSFNAAPEAEIPISAHFTKQDEPTEFEVVADDGAGVLFRYRLAVTKARVIAESLETASTLRSQYRTIFQRSLADDRYVVEQNDFGLDSQQAENVRPNVSLISWARQFGVKIADHVSGWVVTSNVVATGRSYSHPYTIHTRAAGHFANNPEHQEHMRALLREWDLGLSGIVIRKLERARNQRSSDNATPPPDEWLAYGVHSEGDQSWELPFNRESSGTQAAFDLLSHIAAALASGGIMVYDELDNSMHPHLLEPLLRLFASDESNPKGAQIIFTTHAAETVLKFLQRAQVMLVEKEGIVSDTWRLDEVKGVRSDENLAAHYNAGRYGAIPRI